MSIKVTNIFVNRICSVCGSEETNQYFGINDNFIEYKQIFYSFREILSESLDFQIDHNEGKSMEICLDCKDKVIKFYHFKRKVKEIQQQQKKNIKSKRDDSKAAEKRSKVVHNIYQIIENYTEKCSITKIRVDEDSKKLIIESNNTTADEEGGNEDEADEEEMYLATPQFGNDFKTATIFKQEPETDLFDGFNESEHADNESSLLMSENSDSSSVILIKEEEQQQQDEEEEPLSDLFYFQNCHDINSISNKPFKNYHERFSRQEQKKRSTSHSSKEKTSLSSAAMKMRTYRENLKKPENRERFLMHQEKQKEWNRRYYERQQAKTTLMKEIKRLRKKNFNNFTIT